MNSKVEKAAEEVLAFDLDFLAFNKAVFFQFLAAHVDQQGAVRNKDVTSMGLYPSNTLLLPRIPDADVGLFVVARSITTIFGVFRNVLNCIIQIKGSEFESVVTHKGLSFLFNF